MLGNCGSRLGLTPQLEGERVSHHETPESNINWTLSNYYQRQIQDFPEVGAPTLRGGAPTYDFAKFSQKLHGIERIWTRGDPKFLLCRSATGVSLSAQFYSFWCSYVVFRRFWPNKRLAPPSFKGKSWICHLFHSAYSFLFQMFASYTATQASTECRPRIRERFCRGCGVWWRIRIMFRSRCTRT